MGFFVGEDAGGESGVGWGGHGVFFDGGEGGCEEGGWGCGCYLLGVFFNVGVSGEGEGGEWVGKEWIGAQDGNKVFFFLKERG